MDEYLQGRYLWNQRTEPSLRKSLEHFQASARIAPDFALAYNGIADAYLILGAYNFVKPRDVTPLALEALNHAMELDSTAGEPHATRGDFALHVERNYALSIHESDRAIALSPGYATAHNWRSEILLVLGRTDEAIAETQKAIELDPLSPFPHFFLALARETKGDAVQAEKDCRDAIAFDPKFRMGALYSEMLLRQGRFDEALAEAQRLAGTNGSAECILSLGVAQALTGHRKDAEASLARARAMATERYVSSYDFATLEAALGMRDAAILHLHEAIEAPDFRMPSVAVLPSPAFDALKNDAEFQALMAGLRHH
jgi:tetratricopeptide (TPR) repeat protein